MRVAQARVSVRAAFVCGAARQREPAWPGHSDSLGLEPPMAFPGQNHDPHIAASVSGEERALCEPHRRESVHRGLHTSFWTSDRPLVCGKNL